MTAAAALLCFSRNGSAAEFTYWEPAEAVEAAQIVPCRKHCGGVHSIAYHDPQGRIRVVAVPTDHTETKERIA